MIDPEVLLGKEAERLTMPCRQKVLETCNDHHLVPKKVPRDETAKRPSETSAVFRVCGGYTCTYIT